VDRFPLDSSPYFRLCWRNVPRTCESQDLRGDVQEVPAGCAVGVEGVSVPVTYGGVLPVRGGATVSAVGDVFGASGPAGAAKGRERGSGFRDQVRMSEWARAAYADYFEGRGFAGVMGVYRGVIAKDHLTRAL